MGYKCTEADHTVFICTGDDIITIIILYVNDFSITRNNTDQILWDKEELKKHYNMTDLGEISWILSIRVTRDCKAGWIALSQEKYIGEILECFGMSDAHPITTPTLANEHLIKLSSPKIDAKSYQHALGTLMYPMLRTRPDLTYSVAILGQHAANPGPDHQHALEHVFRYLQATCHHQLIYQCGTDAGITLHGFTDADWGSDVNDRRSTSGYVFMLAGGAISWSSKKQSAITLSSTEAEYIAGTHAAKKVIWLRQLLSNLKFLTSSATTLYIDNQSAIAITKNPEFHDRTKHIDIQYHYLRRKVEEEEIDPQYVPTEDQPADILTKGLAHEKHDKFTQMMGVCHPN